MLLHLHLIAPAIVMAWMFSVGGCCCSAGVIPGIATAVATAIEPTVKVIEVCGVCDAGTTPLQMRATMSGVVNDSCTDCGDFNAAWILDQVSGSPCTFEYTGTLPCDGDANCPTCKLEINLEASSLMSLGILQNDGGAGCTTKDGSWAFNPFNSDCSTIDHTTTVVDLIGSGNCNLCEWDDVGGSAEIQVEAI